MTLQPKEFNPIQQVTGQHISLIPQTEDGFLMNAVPLNQSSLPKPPPLNSSLNSLTQSRNFQLLYTFLGTLSETAHSQILKCRSNSNNELVAIKRVNLKKIPEFPFHITPLPSLHFHF